MQRLNPFQKQILSVFVFTTLVALSVGIFVWLGRQVAKSEEDLIRIESEIASLAEERRRARAAELLFKEKEAEIRRIDAFLISSDRPVEFIENLEKIGRGTKNAVSLDLVTDKAAGGSFSFRVTAEGTEANVGNYLSLLELLPHDISIEELTFHRLRASSADSSKEARLTVVINVKTR